MEISFSTQGINKVCWHFSTTEEYISRVATFPGSYAKILIYMKRTPGFAAVGGGARVALAGTCSRRHLAAGLCQGRWHCHLGPVLQMQLLSAGGTRSPAGSGCGSPAEGAAVKMWLWDRNPWRSQLGHSPACPANRWTSPAEPRSNMFFPKKDEKSWHQK